MKRKEKLNKSQVSGQNYYIQLIFLRVGSYIAGIQVNGEHSKYSFVQSFHQLFVVCRIVLNTMN